MKNFYEQTHVKIVKIVKQSGSVSLFRLARADGKEFSTDSNGFVFIPGQFVMVGMFGYGEAPFGPASNPENARHIDVLIQNKGDVSGAFHRASEGDAATLRGPYGNGYPLKFFSGKDIVLVTGGCGIPPIASLIECIISNREDFGVTRLLYGAATPDDILMKKEIKRWSGNINVDVIVDKGDENWEGKVGRVTECLEGVELNSSNTAVAMCGPSPMVNAIEFLINKAGISDRRIFISMERNMQCGIGKCQHCSCGDKLVCVDGPIFHLDQVDNAWDY